MGLRPTKGHEDARKTKSPVAYARGSERGLPSRDREGVGAVFSITDQRLQRSVTYVLLWKRSLAVAVRLLEQGL